MKIIQNKMAGVLFGVVVMVMACCGLEVHAAGGSTSLGASASTVNIGDTVTVTMSVSADVYSAFQMSVSYSSDVLEYTGASSNDCNGGGGALSVVSEVNGSYSISFHFKAVAPGKASVSASAVEAYAVETADAVSISGSSASVTVNNAASDTGNASTDNGNNNGGSTDNGDNNSSSTGNESDGNSTANLSADNSLKSLTISPGTLSPTFQYSTTKYTASVGADVTSVAVDAKVSNSKATVESVSGNTDLQPGENTIKITVKAENGTIAVYTITVNRGGAAGEESDKVEEEPEETPEETPEESVENTGIQLDGISYEMSEKLPEITLPEEFTKTTTTYGEKEVEAYSFPYNNLLLVYLEPIEDNTSEAQEKEGKFYFYNATANEFFPYIYITVGQKYVLVLPNSYAEVIPEGYQEADVTIGELGVKGGQQSNAAAESGQEFYLVYGVDQSGAAGWYRYDSVDMSLQRYVEGEYVVKEEEASEEEDGKLTAISNAYQKLEEKYKKEKASSRITMAVLIFLLIVAIIVIVNILIFKNNHRGGTKGLGKHGDVDYIDFDDL